MVKQLKGFLFPRGGPFPSTSHREAGAVPAALPKTRSTVSEEALAGRTFVALKEERAHGSKQRLCGGQMSGRQTS